MKGRSIWVFVVVFLGVLTNSCKTPGPTGLSDQDRAAILKVSEDGIKLFNAPDRDFEAAVKFYYTEDAMTLSPNEPAVQGRASQIAWYKAYPPFELAEKILELDGRGDLAYARLTYSLKMKMPGAEEPVVDTGKGMEIWKKQKDGSWKVYCDVFNSDLPTATPSEPGAVENAAIEQLMRQITDGYNKKDLAAYEKICDPKILIMEEGVKIDGWAAVRDVTVKEWESLTDFNWEVGMIQVHFVGKDFAWATSEGSFNGKMKDGPDPRGPLWRVVSSIRTAEPGSWFMLTIALCQCRSRTFKRLTARD